MKNDGVEYFDDKIDGMNGVGDDTHSNQSFSISSDEAQCASETISLNIDTSLPPLSDNIEPPSNSPSPTPNQTQLSTLTLNQTMEYVIHCYCGVLSYLYSRRRSKRRSRLELFVDLDSLIIWLMDSEK